MERRTRSASEPVPPQDLPDGSTASALLPFMPNGSTGQAKPPKTNVRKNKEKTVNERTKGHCATQCKHCSEQAEVASPTAQTAHVVNEMLAYITFHYKQCTENDIAVVILDLYDPQAIYDAKRLIWEHYNMHLQPIGTRRNSLVGGSIHEKDLNDIMCAVKEIDKCGKEQSTMFVAANLDKLPRVTPGEIDLICVRERITLLEQATRNMQQCVTRHETVLAAGKATASAQMRGLHVNLPPNESSAASSSIPSLTSQAPPSTSHLSETTWSSVAVDAAAAAAAAATAAAATTATDGFVVPKSQRQKPARKQPDAPSQAKRATKVYYGTKNSEFIKSAPRRLELFVFNVASSTDDKSLREFLADEHVNVLELQRLSKEGAWTQSFCVLITALDPRCTLCTTSGRAASDVDNTIGVALMRRVRRRTMRQDEWPRCRTVDRRQL